jgi:hypothetical protein
VRALLGWVDTRLEEIDPASDWEPFTREVQEQVSRAVAEAFEAVEDGAETIRDRIDALLEDEEVVAPDLGAAQGLDAAALWAGAERELRTADGHRITRALSTGLTALRGSSSGMILLGMMGNLAGVALAAPVSVGVAVFFGGKQFLDTRKTALRQRRQEARSVIRQYVDESNLELSNRVRQLIQDHHRTLRDHYSARLQELSRSTGAALQAAQESLAGDRASREQRAEQLRQWASRLERELAALPAIEREVSG